MSQKLATDDGVLPQPRPLEVQTVDTPKGSARNGSGPSAAGQDGRGALDGVANPVDVTAEGFRSNSQSGVSRVFVLDKKKRPLMPCHPARARKLLRVGRAVVVRRHPFTIRLKDRVGGAVQPIKLKIDPGAKTTGMAIVADGTVQTVLHLTEIEHRGKAVRKKMIQRSMYRRRRRTANLRYRKKRFANRRRAKGWLPPSLMSRSDNILAWLGRYRCMAPIAAVTIERVRFDMQAMENPAISGIEYQQGELQGYEVREYLLEKWQRACAYCGITDVPLQVEHIQPKSRGGSNRVSNLCLACEGCNQEKGSRPVEVFLADRPAVLAKIKRQQKKPLAAAAAVNATRNNIWHRLLGTGLPVEASTGGRTKFNRSRLGIPKTHALDAAATGDVGQVIGWDQPVLAIKATGRGSYQRTRLTKHGFPRGYLMRQKSVQGFQTGDLVRAAVPSGKAAGVHQGRVAVRARGWFVIQTANGKTPDIHVKHCTLLSRADGYTYNQERRAFLPALNGQVPCARM